MSRTASARVLLALSATAIVLVLLPGTASAASCTSTLSDSFGGAWDMQTNYTSVGDGSITVGSSVRSDAYDGFPVLNVSGDGGATWTPYAGTNGACSLTNQSQQLEYPSEAIAGLDVSRKVYVPSGGTAFARFQDILHNPTGAPITVSLDLGGGRDNNGNLGSDSSTTVNDSSSGDGNTTPGDVSAMTTADNWADTWDTSTDVDGNPDGDPTLAHNWQTNLSSSRVDRADVVGRDGTSSDALVWQYDGVTVQPGQTLIYMTTEAMRSDLQQTHDVAAALGQEPPELFAGMSLTELSQLQNWDATDVDKDGVANNGDNCAFVANADQADLDRDGVGDACDDDIDGDGLSNSVEEQVGLDPRNPDTDGDGVNDKNDACAKTRGTGPDGCPVVTASTADTKPPALGVTVPKTTSRDGFLKGFEMDAACDERCSLAATLLGQTSANGLHIAGFNHVFAFTTRGAGTGQRRIKIGACVRNGKVNRRCLKRMRKALPKKHRRFKVRLTVTAVDASGNRTTTNRTVTVR